MKNSIRSILDTIITSELLAEDKDLCEVDYNNQRALISSLFEGDYNKGLIILRLTVIDSLYSTNAAYSYFSFEEMAEKIYSIGHVGKDAAAKRRAARDYFYNVVLTGKDPEGVFSEKYGIQKNLSEGSMQMSLMSKYAYYELMQDKDSYPLGFPIYDRLAKLAYPTVRKMLGEKDYYSMSELETPSIKKYITCLTQLRKAIFAGDKLYAPANCETKYQQFDILDAYLWRMGKFSDGNMSLLLGRNDYIRFITNLGLCNKKAEKNEKRDFNELVLERMVNYPKPFAGTTNEKYMMQLLAHWMVFDKYKNMPPKRGIKFNE